MITRQVLLPLHERLRGRKTLVYYRQLRRNQALDAENVMALRNAKFRQLLQHCIDNVPYYSHHLSQIGVHSADEITMDDLVRLPVLERGTVRRNLKDLVARGGYRGQLISYSTGGSTGEPLVFFTDLDKEAHHNAHKLRARAWFGVYPGTRQIDFWGSPIELEKLSNFRIWKDRWFLNQIVLSAFNLTEERLHNYVQVLRDYKPRLIYGYATVIYRIAEYLQDRQRLLGSWRPDMISCTSEMLYTHQRSVIADVFGCPVANEYGSRDGGAIAHECPAGNMHLATEHTLVEIDKPNEQGVGDILVTNLDAYGMPLLRYRIGDRGSLSDGECSCGLPYPMMSQLAGRSNDFLVGKDGKVIHGLAPIYVLREIRNLRQFKLRQREDRSLEIEMVTAAAYGEAELDEIRRKMRTILELDVGVDFVFRDAIEPEKSGKYRWVISDAIVTKP